MTRPTDNLEAARIALQKARWAAERPITADPEERRRIALQKARWAKETPR